MQWARGDNLVTQAELFAELERTAQAYRAIGAYPHFPPFVDHYYSHPEIKSGDGRTLAGLLDRFTPATPVDRANPRASASGLFLDAGSDQQAGGNADALHYACAVRLSHPEIKSGDGRTLAGLLDRFTPATPVDRDLILSMFASVVWGGAGGTRPAFMIVSDDGRGVGKSTVPEMAGRLVGGAFTISKDDRAGDIVKRLLTPEAATKRAVLYDNVKTNSLSWAELEAMITAAEISGHQMYRGERTRPNTLAWCLTMNGPSMSRDMAQRSVVIKLARPVYSGEWEDSTNAYIDGHRWEIFVDLAAFFQQPAEHLAKHTRWGTWERDVLARLPEPTDAQKVIAERQAAINADDDEAGNIEAHFAKELGALGYSPETDSVHIPNELARDWFIKATGDGATTTAVSRIVNQAFGEGTMTRLRTNPCHTYGRGLLWQPKSGQAVHYDIEDRRGQNSWQHENRHWER